MNDKALKTCEVLASQLYRRSDLFFSPAQSTTFFSKKHFRHASQAESHAQGTQTSAKTYENVNPEIELTDNDRTTEFQKNI